MCNRSFTRNAKYHVQQTTHTIDMRYAGRYTERKENNFDFLPSRPPSDRNNAEPFMWVSGVYDAYVIGINYFWTQNRTQWILEMVSDDDDHEAEELFCEIKCEIQIGRIRIELRSPMAQQFIDLRNKRKFIQLVGHWAERKSRDCLFRWRKMMISSDLFLLSLIIVRRCEWEIKVKWSWVDPFTFYRLRLRLIA